MTANERLDAAFGEGFTAEAQAEVQREHAERYVQTRAVIEFADTRIILTRSSAWDDYGMPGAVKVGRSGRDAVLMMEADWNRIVAVARGHVSDAAQRIIDRVIAGDLAGGVAPKVEPEPLDAERLARAMQDASGVEWPVAWTRYPQNFEWIARQIARRYLAPTDPNPQEPTP